MGGSLLAAASAGDCRNVKGPCPALRPGRLRGAFRFRELVPCFGPLPAAFNSLRSCSFSPRRRSISLPACSNCSRKPRFSASYSFSCLRRSSCLEPSIAPYRDMKPPKCPAFSANQLPDVSSCRAFWRRGEGHRAGAEEGVEKGNRAQGWGTIPPRLGLGPTHQRKSGCHSVIIWPNEVSPLPLVISRSFRRKQPWLRSAIPLHAQEDGLSCVWECHSRTSAVFEGRRLR